MRGFFAPLRMTGKKKGNDNDDSKGFLCTLWAGPFAEDELLRASFYLGMRVKL